MSSLPTSPIRPEIRQVLQRLRTKIQTYLFFHGLALVIVALCAGFFGTLALDWIHFQLRKLELPVAFRAFLAVVMIAVISWVLATQVFLRLLKSKQAKSLAQDSIT